MWICDIIVAGQHKLLPDHDAEAVADVVKLVLLYSGAAPESEDVHIGVDGGFYQLFVSFFGYFSEIQFGIDPVGAFGEDAAAVQLDCYGSGLSAHRISGGVAAGAGVAQHSYFAEADFAFLFIG